MRNEEFYDADYLKFCRQEYEAIRVRTKNRARPVDELDRAEITLDRMFESFYKSVIN